MSQPNDVEVKKRVKSKTLALGLIIVVIVVVAPGMFTIAYSNANGFSRNGAPYEVMDEMMGDTELDETDEDWRVEMKEHMEDRWDEIEDEEWFNEMTAHMEDHMEEMHENMGDMMDDMCP